MCPSFYTSIYLSICLSVYLSVDLSFCLSTCLSIHPSIHLPIHFSIYLSIDRSIHPSIYPSVLLSIYPSIHLSIYPPIYLSIYLTASLKTNLSCETSSIFELDNTKNETVLRDFLNFWTWQHQKRNSSARLPRFVNLTTSKTKQFCETSSVFELDNIKNETVLRDFLQNWRPRTNKFADFSIPPV